MDETQIASLERADFEEWAEQKQPWLVEDAGSPLSFPHHHQEQPMTAPTRYPLQWPVGWKRTPWHERKKASFKKGEKPITVFGAVERLLVELGRMGIGEDDIVISTNIALRLDGLPRSNEASPSDVGVAAYWQEAKKPMRCMAIDAYDTVQGNIAAVAMTLSYMRGIERHGGAFIMDRAFTGFTALPAPIVAGMSRPWWEVLGVHMHATPEAIQTAYRKLASEAHPDKGGTAERMAEINRARDEGLAA